MDKPAIYGVDGPKWWVNERKIWDDHSSWVNEFYEMWSSIVENVVVKPIPPNAALAIDSPIATWNKFIVKSAQLFDTILFMHSLAFLFKDTDCCW